MHLVDHEHLETPLHGFVNRLLEQLLNFIDASVRGGIQFGVVDKMTRIDVGTSGADTTRFSRDTGFAVEGFRQDTRHRGFAHAACAGE